MDPVCRTEFSLVMAFVFGNADLKKAAVIMPYGIIISLAAFLIISLFFWRCPDCGRQFEIRHGQWTKYLSAHIAGRFCVTGEEKLKATCTLVFSTPSPSVP